MIRVFGSFLYQTFLETFHFIYESISQYSGDFNALRSMNIMVYCGRQMFFLAGPVMAVILIAVVIVNVAQVKWRPTMKPLQPKFSKINPVSGMKRMFSKDKIFDLFKAIAKLAVLFYVIYNELADEWGMVVNIYSLDLMSALQLLINTVINIGIKISFVFLILAGVDYYYQRRKFKNDMKMTKQEVKDEYKNTEGDPQIKGRQRRKMQEVSQRRMMQDVPKADVVITNPTHLAVALKYDAEVSAAPVVLAKGEDYLAQRIKEIARDNQIEIVENKPLARMLYHNVDIGAEIPPELYQAVAEVLAVVFQTR